MEYGDLVTRQDEILADIGRSTLRVNALQAELDGQTRQIEHLRGAAAMLREIIESVSEPPSNVKPIREKD